MTIKGLNHLTLAVTDLDRAIGFYRDVLGLALRARWDEGAYFEAGALWLCLSHDPNAATASRGDYTHFAFDVAPESFAAMAESITRHAPIWKDNRSEGSSLYFRDPDGHKLELHVGSLASRLDHYRRTAKGRVTVFD